MARASHLHLDDAADEAGVDAEGEEQWSPVEPHRPGRWAAEAGWVEVEDGRVSHVLTELVEGPDEGGVDMPPLVFEADVGAVEARTGESPVGEDEPGTVPGRVFHVPGVRAVVEGVKGFT